MQGSNNVSAHSCWQKIIKKNSQIVAGQGFEKPWRGARVSEKQPPSESSKKKYGNMNNNCTNYWYGLNQCNSFSDVTSVNAGKQPVD